MASLHTRALCHVSKPVWTNRTHCVCIVQFGARLIVAPVIQIYSLTFICRRELVAPAPGGALLGGLQVHHSRSAGIVSQQQGQAEPSVWDWSCMTAKLLANAVAVPPQPPRALRCQGFGCTTQTVAVSCVLETTLLASLCVQLSANRSILMWQRLSGGAKAVAPSVTDHLLSSAVLQT